MVDAVLERFVERFLPGVVVEIMGDGEQVVLQAAPHDTLHLRPPKLARQPAEVVLDASDYRCTNLFTVLDARTCVQVVHHGGEEVRGAVLVGIALLKPGH